jgi:hypothetical protein
MLVAQAFMKQRDPTMEALNEVLSQLQDIKKELDRIDHKIDNLTDLVLDGFAKVLIGQAVISREISDVKQVLNSYVREQKAQDAINVFLDQLRDQRAIFTLANQCASKTTLNVHSTNDCVAKFADELSTKPLEQIVLNVGSPHLFDSASTNVALSVGVDYNLNNGALPKFYFSLPRFFADAPQAFTAMTARNQEAIAAASWMLLNLQRGETLANPENLAADLSVLLLAAQLRPDLITVPNADILLSEAIQRVTDTEIFFEHTVQNQAYVENVWQMLAMSLKTYDDDVSRAVEDALNRPKDGAKKTFLGQFIDPCDPANGIPSIHIPASGPAGNIESLVPDIFWSAEDMGLGRIGKCFEHSVADTIMEGNNAFHEWRFTIIIFWNPAQKQPDGSFTQIPLQAERVVKTNASKILQKRSITSKNHFSTFLGGSVLTAWWSWDGWAANHNDNSATPWKVYECLKGKLPPNNCPGGNARFIPANAFMTEGSNEIPDDRVAATARELGKAVHEKLTTLISSRSQVWNPRKLALEEVSADKILLDRPIWTTSTLSDDMSMYSSRYMFAEQLVLLSGYHENAVSKCLATLDDFSPQKVVANLPNVFGNTKWRLSDVLVERMNGVSKSCVGTGIKSNLRSTKAELEKVLANVPTRH